MPMITLKVSVTGIRWDIDDGGEVPSTQMVLDNIQVKESDYLESKTDTDAMEELIADEVSDAITNASGWCHTGFEIEKIERIDN